MRESRFRIAQPLMQVAIVVAMLAVPGQSALAKPAGADGPTTAAGVKQFWTCGMHPWVFLPKAGDCPICHMTLVPVDPAKFTGQIAIDPVITQNIGVRIVPVTTGPVTAVIRTVGTVDFNEPAVRDVNLKIGGWVEKLYVDYVGQQVKEGQPLLELYSPELFSAQTEYIQAFRQQPRTPADGNGRGNDSTMLESSRMRLENFGISARQIKELEQAGKPTRTMVLASPFTGTVVTKDVFEGKKVEPGAQLLRIADLSKVWVMVALYEYQTPYVQVGQEAGMSLAYVPGQVFKGKVAYIYPTLNPETRQLKVRLEFDNPHLLLKPGMFTNIEIRSTLAQDRTLAPRESVIDTGQRQVAFVSLGSGRFEPRIVKTGVEAEGGMVEILDGLKSGEMVVSSSQFLLDSESNLREALVKMVKGDLAANQSSSAAPTTAPAQGEALGESADGALAQVLQAYFGVGQTLSSDRMEGVSDGARQMAGGVDRLLAMPAPDEHFWHRHGEAAQIRAKALELVEARDIEAARQAFADVSIAMDKLLQAVGVPAEVGAEVQELHCPMYREGQGGTVWLQVAGEVRNPYFGSMMLGCFDRKVTLPQARSASAGGAAVSGSQPVPTTMPTSIPSQAAPEMSHE
ncbi:MAG: efflux RND transporter periplasmic adaptor subunit [Phycisphaerae bacterium]|jgi:multidrug efflux pump subunit AcrA (membrane-fusion protein)